MKYKAVKPITLQAVYDVGDKTCEEFRYEFNEFLCWGFSLLGNKMNFFSAINFNALESRLERRPKWDNFLLNHGFIKKVEDEVFYSAGDHFCHKRGDEYMLTFVGGNRWVQMLRADGKGCYAASEEVVDVWRITEKEFTTITCNHPECFVKIEEAHDSRGDFCMWARQCSLKKYKGEYKGEETE